MRSVLALLGLVALLSASPIATAQRRTPRACPNVVPEDQLCARFVQGQMCRYGRNTLCICRRRSARDRQPHWYCSP